MKKEIISVLKYFAFFEYPPSKDQIYTFLPVKCDKEVFLRYLEELKNERQISMRNNRYWLTSCKSFYSYFKERSELTKKKIYMVKTYLHIIGKLPWIKYIGISGSASMNNAKLSSDVDVFIITSFKRLWTARFFSILIAKYMGLRNSRHPARICLNMFFDESDVLIRKEKRTAYVAHEIIQLNNFLSKNCTYENFLNENKWVKKIYPNAVFPYVSNEFTRINPHFVLMDILEYLLKIIQLKIIKNRLSQEYITDTQLWLIQKDFERKVTDLFPNK